MEGPAHPFGLQWLPGSSPGGGADRLPGSHARLEAPPSAELDRVARRALELLEQPVPVIVGDQVDDDQVGDVLELPFSRAAAAGYAAFRSRRIAAHLLHVGLQEYATWYEMLADQIERDFSLPPPGLGGVA